MGTKSIEVSIAGVSYRIRSDADATYIRSLAGFVDEKIREARGASQPAPTQTMAVLAAMNIADDLFQERQRREGLKTRVRERSRALLALLDREERKHLRSNR